jgi:uncharacterized membrane protein YdjX (TVP38/TMEM64 family)
MPEQASFVNSPDGPRARRARGLWLAGAVVLLIAVVYAAGWHRQISPETFVHYRAEIVGFVASHAAAAVAAYIALYIAVVGLSIPAAVFLTVAGGFLFGTVTGALAAIVGASVGATLIFCIARSAVGERIAGRAGPFAEKFAQGFRADAFSYLLFLRLVPVPFWLVNLASALFNVSLRTFVAATVLGITPAAFVLSFFGAGLDSVLAAQEVSFKACLAAGRSDCRVDIDVYAILTPQLLAALLSLGALALIPVVVKRLRARRRVAP